MGAELIQSEPSTATYLLDLAAQKVRVVQVLAHGVTLPMALGAAEALSPDFAPLVTLKALSYFGDGDLPALPTHVKETLANAAAAVHAPSRNVRLSNRLSER